MISAISNSNNYMNYLQQSQSTQNKSGPPDLFSALDTDGSDGISQSELDTWAKNMSTATGTSIDTTSAISTYDTNGDGVLSASELNSFLKSSGMTPPAGGPPPGPPPTDNGSSGNATSIVSSYDTNGDGVLSSSELQAYLDDNAATSSANDTSSLQQALSACLMNVSQSMGAGSNLSSINTIDFSA